MAGQRVQVPFGFRSSSEVWLLEAETPSNGFLDALGTTALGDGVLTPQLRGKTATSWELGGFCVNQRSLSLVSSIWPPGWRHYSLGVGGDSGP